MSKIIYWSEKKSIEKLKNTISNNNIAITSTDTVLGLLGNVTKKSFDKISEIKSRTKKPYLILINSVEKLKNFIDEKTLNNQDIIKLIKQHWPGPLTIIFKAKNNLSDFLKTDNNTIAIRCPKHEGLQEILKFFDGLFSTSANKANQETPKSLEQLDDEIAKQVDLIIIDKVVDTKNKFYQTLPSTIIDVSKVNSFNSDNIEVIRKGAYPIKELEDTYGVKFKK